MESKVSLVSTFLNPALLRPSRVCTQVPATGWQVGGRGPAPQPLDLGTLPLEKGRGLRRRTRSSRQPQRRALTRSQVRHCTRLRMEPSKMSEMTLR